MQAEGARREATQQARLGLGLGLELGLGLGIGLRLGLGLGLGLGLLCHDDGDVGRIQASLS